MTFVSRVSELHDQAMEIAEQAHIARLKGETEASSALSRQALDYESAAAELVAYTAIEPIRSVLHRSAASLALNCGELRTAEKLIAIGLAGDPPEEIARELRELLLQVFEQIGQRQLTE
jgi:hypothetical protein